MLVYISWMADDVKDEQNRAIQSNHTVTVRRIARNLEAGNRQWESWLLRIGGELIAYVGPEGQAMIPADHLVELKNQKELYQGALEGKSSIGVGINIHEATKALQVAQKRGGDRIVLWTDNMEDELRDEAAEDNDLLQAPSQEPETQAVAAPIPEPAQAQPQPTAQPPVQPQQDNKEAIKQGVVAILQEVQKAKPALEQLKQENPEAYQIINAAIQAMIEMAKAQFGQVQPQSAPASAPSDQAAPAAGFAIPGGDVNPPTPAPKAPPAQRKNLVLPVGAERNGKVKVKHADGTVSWVSVRSGQVMGEEGQAISSRNQ